MEPQALEPQVLTAEFREYIERIYSPDGTRPHDKVNGPCKCGEIHTPYEFQLKAVREFRAAIES